MANRKQQTDKEVSESVQRVAEANAKPKKPANPASKVILNRTVRMGMAAPLHPRAAADKAKRLAELTSAAEEARMQGDKAREAEAAEVSRVRTDPLGLDKPNRSKPQKAKARVQAKKEQAFAQKNFKPEPPVNKEKVKATMEKYGEKAARKSKTGRTTVPMKGVGGYVAKDKAGNTLKSTGDYSLWKPKRSGKSK
jgi:cobalamin biosynthesis Mg chelatase CobN